MTKKVILYLTSIGNSKLYDFNALIPGSTYKYTDLGIDTPFM